MTPSQNPGFSHGNSDPTVIQTHTGNPDVSAIQTQTLPPNPALLEAQGGFVCTGQGSQSDVLNKRQEQTRPEISCVCQQGADGGAGHRRLLA